MYTFFQASVAHAMTQLILHEDLSRIPPLLHVLPWNSDQKPELQSRMHHMTRDLKPSSSLPVNSQ